MKKSTINKLLLGVIAFLVVAICILTVQIVTRPRYLNTSEPETAIIAEASTDSDTTGDEKEDIEETTSSEVKMLRGKTSTKVNIRDAASEDAKVLETVEEGTEFDIIEIQDNGWTQIKYEDGVAYISSSYIIIIE